MSKIVPLPYYLSGPPESADYCVCFRTGGTQNFRWMRTSDVYTRDQVMASVTGSRRMGYPAYYARSAQLNAIGLPETYDYQPSGE